MTETRTTSSTGGQKGVKLARFDLIPAGPLKELAEHYGRGARKYANHQWRQGYEWSKSIAAKARHDNAFMAGEDYDVCSNDPTGCSFVDANGDAYEPLEPDTCYNHTGSHHMAASAWHAFLLLEFKDTHPQHDDRYVVSNTLEEDVEVEWSDPVLPYREAVADALVELAEITATPPLLWGLPPEYRALVESVARLEQDIAAKAWPVRFICVGDGIEDVKADEFSIEFYGEALEADPAVVRQMINDRLYNRRDF